MSSFIVPNSILTETNGRLKIQFRNLNVSFMNALRRTILCDIPTVVFKTTPYHLCKCEILENTTRMNNELLKHRLSAVPIHITNLDPSFLQKWFVEVEVENKTENIFYVTTEHFMIHKKLETEIETTDTQVGGGDKKDGINKKDDEDGKKDDDDIELSRNEVFPINEFSNQYIDIVLLQPKYMDQQKADKVHFRCDLTVGCAREDSNYNVVSECFFVNTCDEEKGKKELMKMREEWKKRGLEKDEIEKEAQNWMLLDSFRITVPNSYDFSMKTIGVYSNEQIVFMACGILTSRLKEILENDEKFVLENSTTTTMTNAFEIWLMNEDHTIGKMLEYCFYSSLFENAKQLHYVGFVKKHPHDNKSMIRLAYKRPISLSDVKTDFFRVVRDSIAVLKDISKGFDTDGGGDKDRASDKDREDRASDKDKAQDKDVKDGSSKSKK